jgi:hypothetical protein
MNRQADDAWRSYLQELPAVVPPAGLRTRVLDAWPPSRRRRRAAWLLAAAAAVAALALALPLGFAPGPVPAPVADDPLLASQLLEQRLLASPAAANPDLQAGIAEIDRALGAAYRRGAPGEELDGLWRARARALEQGLAAAPPQPVRI